MAAEEIKALIIRDLCFNYSDGRTGLDGVSLECDAGTKVCLVGRNGSGKTTLLLHINGLLDGKGYIEVCGIKRSRKTMKQIRGKTGLLFSQVEHHFIMPELFSDILLGTEAGTAEYRKAMEIIEYFDLFRYRGRNPLELSSGEMKRAALAGILARQPELLLLDEPLQNLDRENAERLLSILASLDVTMVIATHSRFIVENIADHVAVMDAGKITGFYMKRDALKRKDIRNLLL